MTQTSTMEEQIARVIKDFRLDEPLTPSKGLFQADALSLQNAILALLPAAVAGEDVVERDGFYAWVVEDGRSPTDAPRYLQRIDNDGPHSVKANWTTNWRTAWKFADKQSAEYACDNIYETMIDYWHRVAEHHFPLASASLLRPQAAREIPDGWKPIETAPWDYEVILLYQPASNGNAEAIGQGHRTSLDEHAHNKWIFQATSWRAEPTHWMPLPAAPTPSPAGIGSVEADTRSGLEEAAKKVVELRGNAVGMMCSGSEKDKQVYRYELHFQKLKDMHAFDDALRYLERAIKSPAPGNG